MSNCYKNFPVIINYSDNTTYNIYANSVSLSEDINLENSSSLGIKGSKAVFNRSAPNGQLTVDSYLTNDLSIFNNLKESNDQNITIQVGPYSCPSPCLLSSMSINIVAGEPITVQRTFNYFGELTTGTAPPPTGDVINPVVAENINISGFSDAGMSDQISSIDWSFSQEYEQYNLLGETTPKVVFREGQVQLSVQGEGLPSSLVSDSCLVPPKVYSISVSGCDGEDLGSLLITGYLQARTSDIASEQDEVNSASIIQYL
jgi:hypothetical protein